MATARKPRRVPPKRKFTRLSDGQGELWRHEPDKVGRVVNGRRRNPETELCAQIRDYCRRHPGLIKLRRTHCGISFSRDGAVLNHGPESWPDFTGGTWFGAAVVVECKREGEEPNEDQENEMATLREWGWIVISCASIAEFHQRLHDEANRRGKGTW